MTGLVYAPDVLVAAERGDPALWRLHRAALLRDQTPLVLAPVLAGAAFPTPGAGLPTADGATDRTGEPATRLAALLAGCALVDFPVGAAWDVLRLRRLAPGTDLVTAAVVLAALAARAAVVSADPDRYLRPAHALGITLSTIAPTG